MKIIKTKYIAATNTKSARVKAYDDNKNQITMPWHTDSEIEDNHKLAVQLLIDKLDLNHPEFTKGGRPLKIRCFGVFKNEMIFFCERVKK